MKMDKIIKDIQEIDGYKGLAILNNSNGGVLYIDESEKEIDLAFSSNIFNDIFRKLNEATLDIGLSNLTHLEVETEDGITFLLYKNKTYSIFTIFNPKSNISLVKIILAKFLKEE
jgi:predicted regulator of Ras-like GTPase activity (Roadblock/LC7/MglB family)